MGTIATAMVPIVSTLKRQNLETTTRTHLHPEVGKESQAPRWTGTGHKAQDVARTRTLVVAGKCAEVIRNTGIESRKRRRERPRSKRARTRCRRRVTAGETRIGTPCKTAHGGITSAGV